MATTDATVIYHETWNSKVGVWTVTPVIDTSLYATGDALHTNDLLFSGAARVAGGGGSIRKLTIIDNDLESAAMELWLFSAAISATHTANGAWNAADADLANVVAVIPSGPYYASSAGSVSINASLDYRYRTSGGTSLYGVLVVRAGPTYTAATDLTIKLTAELD